MNSRFTVHIYSWIVKGSVSVANGQAMVVNFYPVGSIPTSVFFMPTAVSTNKMFSII